MSPNKSPFFFLLLFLALPLFFFLAPVTTSTRRLQSSITAGDDPLINSTCRHTRYYQLCLSSLLSNPKSHNADLPTLAAISVELAISNARSTLAYVATLLKQPSFDAFAANCLDDCHTLYSDAIANLGEAMDALAAATHFSYDTVNFKVSGAMTDSDTCEDSFQDRDGYASPLTQRNNEFSMLCSNALAISALLRSS